MCVTYSKSENVLMASALRQPQTDSNHAACSIPNVVSSSFEMPLIENMAATVARNVCSSTPTTAHPAISDKSCFSESCTLVHPKGTKRRKPAENESNRAPFHRNKERNTNTTFSTNKKSGTNRNDSRVSAHPGRTTLKPRVESFLELRSLLTEIQSTFRMEIETLKLSISRQESTLATLIPGSSKLPLALNLHPHFPHNQGTWPQHGQILQPHLPSHPQSFVHR